MMLSPQEILRQYGIAYEDSGRYYTTCPHCSKDRRNKNAKCLGVTIDAKGVRWGCNHCEWTGPEKGRGNGKAADDLTTYDYVDADGALIFQKIRNPPGSEPRFWCRRPNGKDWINNLKGISNKPLYRWSEIVKAIKEDREIAIVEGEKDADNLRRLGIPATCNFDGASDVIKNLKAKSKWKADYSEQLRGARLVVFNDHDAAGYEHANTVCRLSLGVAKHVRRLDLAPHWPEIPKGGDVSDYLAAGHSAEQLKELIENAPEYQPANGAANHQAANDVAPGGLEDMIALDFAEQYGGDYRYVAQTSQWLRWNQTRWQAEKTLLAFDQSRALCRAAGDAKAKTVAAVVALARTDRRIAATVEQWDHDPEILCAGTVTIDLRTGQERPPERLDYCTKQTGVAPAPPGTPCDVWLKFLDRVTNKDGELIGFLQRYLGYCLTGHVSEHVFAFLFGTGANGKGTFIRTVSAILNDYCVVSPIEMFLLSKYDRHPTEVARLHKVRVTVAQETPKARCWDEAKIKNMTGGDVLTARFMRGDFFDFDPTHKLFVVGNHKPTLLNVDEAFRRRFLLVPFTVTIPVGERDPELSEKLRAEHPAILRWMIDGCLQWRENGLGIPPSVRDASDEYFAEQDDLTYWAEECTERKPRSFTTTSALYRSWQKWCSERGALIGTQKAFTESLKDRGYSYKHTKNARGFSDLALKSGEETQTEADLR